MKRTHAVGIALVTSVVAVAVACSFPAPELLDVADANGTDTSVPTAPPDGTAPPNVDATPSNDASADGAEPPPDATKIDGDANIVVDGQVVNCDEDDDKFPKIGAGCGGFDCDDKNPDVRPDRDFNTLAPLPGTGPGKGGDWNCRNGVEIQGGTVTEDCPLTALGCAREGFIGQVTCGGMGRYIKCEPAGAGCNRVIDDRTRPVGCR